jgi:Na+/melibiose symporter-like transporter
VPTTGLLRERDFRLLTGAIGVSAVGDWLATVPLVLSVQEMTGSGIAVSAVLICLWAPIVILAGHVGLLVDRFETKRLFATVSLAQAAVAVALAFAGEPAVILPLTALLGVGFAISQAAEFALVPAVAGVGREQEANGYVESARSIGLVGGPLLGGLVAATGGIEWAMLVNAATFVALAGAILALHAERPPVREEDGESPRARDGIAQLFRDPTLALAMGVAFVSLLFMSASIPADVFYVKDVLGMGDFAYGAVLSVWMVGMLVGALLVSRRIPAASLALAAFAAVAVQGLGKAVPPAWLVYWFMLAWYAVAGTAHGVKNVAFRTLIHLRVPPRAHGRAFAAYNGIRNSAELGALAFGGVLVATLGPRATLVVAGGVAALAGVAGLLVLARRRSLHGVEPVVSPGLDAP